MADVKAIEVPTYINRAGEQMQTEISRRQVAPVNLIQAAKQIRGLVGDLWTPECMAALKSLIQMARFHKTLSLKLQKVSKLQPKTKITSGWRVIHERT